MKDKIIPDNAVLNSAASWVTIDQVLWMNVLVTMNKVYKVPFVQNSNTTKELQCQRHGLYCMKSYAILLEYVDENLRPNANAREDISIYEL